MKRLYRAEDARYSEDAACLDYRTCLAVKDLFKEYLGQGYCPREISKIMQDSINQLELEAVLDLPKSS